MKPTKRIQLHAFEHAGHPLLIGPVLNVDETLRVLLIDSNRLEWAIDNKPLIHPMKLVFIDAGMQTTSGAWVFELSLNETIKLYGADKAKVVVPKKRVFLT